MSGRGAQSVSLVSAVGWMLFITGLEVHRLNEPGVCQYRLLPLCQVQAMDMLLSASYIDPVCSHSIGRERNTALGRGLHPDMHTYLTQVCTYSSIGMLSHHKIDWFLISDFALVLASVAVMLGHFKSLINSYSVLQRITGRLLVESH